MIESGPASAGAHHDGEPGTARVRKRRRRDVTGILVLDKPSGMTSNRALQRVRGLFAARKAGHTGSLDPLASGVLPICLGEATKISGLLLDARKCYEVVARLGIRTDTADADGSVVETGDWSHVDLAAARQALTGFLGESEQVPPMYSALKHGGRRLYDLAREGRTVDRAARPVTIHSIEALGLRGSELALRVCCSKGTYVRTLVEDIAAALGTVAHVAVLRRMAVGCLDQSRMITMAQIEHAAGLGFQALDALLEAPDTALPGLPAVVLDADEARRILSGQAVESPPAAGPGLVRLYAPGGRFLGLGRVRDDGRLAPQRLFQVEAPPGPERDSGAGSAET